MNMVCAFGLGLSCIAGLACSAQALELTHEPTKEVAGQADGLGIADVQQVSPYRELQYHVDSGFVSVDDAQLADHQRAIQESVWSTVVQVDDAGWIRLRFGEVSLAKSTEHVRESYIRITSLEDGYEQYLDTQSLKEWSNTSAYFNGSAVRVELMVSPNTTAQINRVQVRGVQVSAPVSVDRSICFSVDDRVLSSDPRDGRLMPIGCSAWLFGEHGSCFLTASHCSPGGGDVMQFNVPLSSSGGGYRNPPPQDQYVVDGASVQRSSNIFIGNDWAFFGTFDNSTTGLSPLAAQGLSHTLANSMPPVDGRPIRITGYGTVSSPVSPTWNGVQKTHVGPLISISGDRVQYQTDTTGGNSGSVILDDSTNTAIGIHTNAGCGSGGGANNGTGLSNSGLQNALANPIGICEPRSIQASLLLEPTHVSPDGGDAVTLLIDNLFDHTVTGSPMMFVDSGSGFVGSPMSASGVDQYDGVFAAAACGSSLSYYFEITDEEGTVVSVPETGVFHTIALDGLTTEFEDDFENNLGWVTFVEGAFNGEWIRTIPIGHGLGDPDTDADGSSRCYVTSNNNGEDVDGGGVVLMSPVIDLTGLESPTLRLSAWMDASPEDTFEIAVTNNAGISWVVVDTLSQTAGWEELAYPIDAFVSPTIAFRAKITVSDNGADSRVEGGVDAFRVASEVCDSACPADLTGDGVLDFFDVSAFLSAFSVQDPSADLTGDGVYDFFDVSAFLSAFNAGCG